MAIILCWIVTVTVFMLPDICLNIVLAERVFVSSIKQLQSINEFWANSFIFFIKFWFKTTIGSTMIYALLFRTITNIPCLCILLTYYNFRKKRENYLNQALKPIEQNINSGESLKRYKNLNIEEGKEKPLKPQAPKIAMFDSKLNVIDENCEMRGSNNLQADNREIKEKAPLSPIDSSPSSNSRVPDSLHIIWDGNKAKSLDIRSSSFNNTTGSSSLETSGSAANSTKTRYSSPPLYSNIYPKMIEYKNQTEPIYHRPSSTKLLHLNNHLIYLPKGPTINQNEISLNTNTNLSIASDLLKDAPITKPKS